LLNDEMILNVEISEKEKEFYEKIEIDKYPGVKIVEDFEVIKEIRREKKKVLVKHQPVKGKKQPQGKKKKGGGQNKLDVEIETDEWIDKEYEVKKRKGDKIQIKIGNFIKKARHDLASVSNKIRMFGNKTKVSFVTVMRDWINDKVIEELEHLNKKTKRIVMNPKVIILLTTEEMVKYYSHKRKRIFMKYYGLDVLLIRYEGLSVRNTMKYDYLYENCQYIYRSLKLKEMKTSLYHRARMIPNYMNEPLKYEEFCRQLYDNVIGPRKQLGKDEIIKNAVFFKKNKKEVISMLKDIINKKRLNIGMIDELKKRGIAANTLKSIVDFCVRLKYDLC